MKIKEIVENIDVSTGESLGYIINDRWHTDSLTGIYKNDIKKFLQAGNTITPSVTSTDILDKLTTDTKLALSKYYKNKLAYEVAHIVVTVKVNNTDIPFDGDENSQNRISRAMDALPTDTSTTEWIAADNSMPTVSRSEFRNILIASGEAQRKLAIGYRKLLNNLATLELGTDVGLLKYKYSEIKKVKVTDDVIDITNILNLTEIPEGVNS